MIYGLPLPIAFVSGLLLPVEPQIWNLLWRPIFDPVMDREFVQDLLLTTIEVQFANVVNLVQPLVEYALSIFLCPLVWLT
ncbi:hypothetical protein XELAEV_18003786mg [Xenopus laevis]|uniref:Uncharacterized protein n=1 Tax=Xenopus laevis TaxID=8355 RepID=A0A974BN38_XENLA|nr:hypothetical protein XELAEV_18003786mg [Xenopus laevis]